VSGEEKAGLSEVGFGLAAIGVGALAIVCCAGLPLLAAFAGSLALGAVVGIAAGAVALIALSSLLIVRARRRSACEAEPRGGASPGAKRREAL
jgi:hypothetical protein